MSLTVKDLAIRPATADETARFVRETCLKVRQPRTTPVSWHVWQEMHGPTVDAYLARSRVLVADFEGVVLGFLVADEGVVRMLYVKAELRGHGFGMALLSAAGIGTTVPAWRPTQSWHRWCERRGLTTKSER